MSTNPIYRTHFQNVVDVKLLLVFVSCFFLFLLMLSHRKQALALSKNCHCFVSFFPIRSIEELGRPENKTKLRAFLRILFCMPLNVCERCVLYEPHSIFQSTQNYIMSALLVGWDRIFLFLFFFFVVYSALVLSLAFQHCRHDMTLFIVTFVSFVVLICCVHFTHSLSCFEQTNGRTFICCCCCCVLCGFVSLSQMHMMRSSYVWVQRICVLSNAIDVNISSFNDTQRLYV